MRTTKITVIALKTSIGWPTCFIMFHHQNCREIPQIAKCQRAIQYPQCLQSPPALSDSGFFGKKCCGNHKKPMVLSVFQVMVFGKKVWKKRVLWRILWYFHIWACLKMRCAHEMNHVPMENDEKPSNSCSDKAIFPPSTIQASPKLI